MKANQMLILTNMLAKIISEMDDLKAMIKTVYVEEYLEEEGKNHKGHLKNGQMKNGVM